MIGARIKAVRKSLGISQEELAEKAGVHHNTIARWEREELDPRRASIVKLASALHTTVAYLTGETDDPARSAPAEQPLPESNVRPIPGPYVMVPVLGPESTVCCGCGLDNSDVFPTPERVEPIPESWLTGPKGDYPHYITHVDGDSMEPLIQDGERVLVNPNQEPMNGDVVVATWRDRSMVKGVAFERNGDVHLVPMNKQYPEIIIKEEDRPYELQFNGVVIRYLGVDRVARGWM
ncbi:MAG: XRE family transcriptional regulator [Fretibacterium sp.]|nr:XRE family transcriptional regulator [Fretibacterium sp.]